VGSRSHHSCRQDQQGCWHATRDGFPPARLRERLPARCAGNSLQACPTQQRSVGHARAPHGQATGWFSALAEPSPVGRCGATAESSSSSSSSISSSSSSVNLRQVNSHQHSICCRQGQTRHTTARCTRCTRCTHCHTGCSCCNRGVWGFGCIGCPCGAHSSRPCS